MLGLIEQLMLKRYSHVTIKAYRSYFSQFLLYFSKKDPQEIQKSDVQSYLPNEIQNRKWSESTQNQAVNAIKFYDEQVLG